MDSKKQLNLCGLSIRRLRVERGWSQAHLALKCQLVGWDASRDIIARIEQRNRVISDIDLAKLARVLDVPVERLFPSR